MDHRAIFVDSRLRACKARLRGYDGELAITVIPAKAGIQMNYPNLLRSYRISSQTANIKA